MWMMVVVNGMMAVLLCSDNGIGRLSRVSRKENGDLRVYKYAYFVQLIEQFL